MLPSNEHKVCKLIKYFYGLKQVPKQWHEKFDYVILSNGFVSNYYDKCLYIKKCENIVIFLCIYVDNNKMNEILEIKRFLTSTFKMKDLRLVNTILGIKVK